MPTTCNSSDYRGSSLPGEERRKKTRNFESAQSEETFIPADIDETGFDNKVNSVRFIFSKDVESSSYLKRIDDNFSIASSNDDGKNPSSGSNSSPGKEKAVSINLSSRNCTKLEVVGAKEVAKLLWWFHGFIIFGVAFSIVFVAIANTVYLRLDNLQGVRVRYYSLPVSYELVLAIANILCFLYALCLSVAYTSRIVRLRRSDRTHEQVWVILLTVAAAIYLNPYESIVRIMNNAQYDLRQEPLYEAVSRFHDSLRDASFTASTLFYVWASIHSYRVLEGRLGFVFYVPKVLFVVLYMLLKQFAFWKFTIYMSEMPIASFIAMIYLYRTLRSWPLSGVLCVAAVTLYEIVLLTWIVKQIRVTRCVLKAKDYMKHRSKQIGVRFFLYHNLTFYVVFWSCYLLLLLGLPPGAQLASKILFNVSYVEVQYVPLGLTVLYLSYVTLEAYMKLPADAIGLYGWFRPQPPKVEGLLDRITYRKREVHPHKVQTNCFVMETHAVMFNFAWLVYYYDTGKMSKLKRIQNSFHHEVHEVVFNKITDTRVLVIDDVTRIIVSFRGTNSSTNLRTDLKAFRVKVKRIFPSSRATGRIFSDAGMDEVVDARMNSRDTELARVHRGFAEAYLSVSSGVMTAIRRLYEGQPRPVFLTGHSLGGALATLCAFDCVWTLNLGPRDIHVATYGSPRVGNAAFRRAYDNVVPASWRVSIAADIITKLPKMDYEHVGKKVMITTAGDLFIDPNTLELSKWSGDTASFVHHRKSSYLLAMKSWCNRHENGVYRPPFWDWPFSPEEGRRWPDAVRNESIEQHHQGRRRNLIHQDAMINALNDSISENVSDGALENWSRMVSRVLLDNIGHK